MPLREEYERSGNWLFRWRSYIPVLFFCVALFSLKYSKPLQNESVDLMWEAFCLSVSYVGLVIRILTVGHTPSRTSGRNTRGQVADSLNTTGIYSLVRHPLYVGNFLMWFGISLFPMLWWLSALCVLTFWLYYERIMFAEEAYLREKFGEPYVHWAEKTPAVIPDFRNYVRSTLPFSWKKVMRKEYNGFLAVALCLFVMELLGDYLSGAGSHINIMWAVVVVVAFTIWVAFRSLKNYTSLLKSQRLTLPEKLDR